MTKKIMVVDDERSLLELMNAILGSAGYNVTTASSGEECLKKLKTEKPDLILLDMMMPGMSGRETAANIRKNSETKELKIAFLTVAKFSESGKGILITMNILDYITKPFDNEDLLKRVKKII
ncbi:MAG: response regulator [Nanoarchaeota archaeon]|nr:response regulator [Nanoarchaeota archaeon]